MLPRTRDPPLCPWAHRDSRNSEFASGTPSRTARVSAREGLGEGPSEGGALRGRGRTERTHASGVGSSRAQLVVLAPRAAEAGAPPLRVAGRGETEVKGDVHGGSQRDHGRIEVRAKCCGGAGFGDRRRSEKIWICRRVTDTGFCSWEQEFGRGGEANARTLGRTSPLGRVNAG